MSKSLLGLGKTVARIPPEAAALSKEDEKVFSLGSTR